VKPWKRVAAMLVANATGAALAWQFCNAYSYGLLARAVCSGIFCALCTAAMATALEDL